MLARIIFTFTRVTLYYVRLIFMLARIILYYGRLIFMLARIILYYARVTFIFKWLIFTFSRIILYLKRITCTNGVVVLSQIINKATKSHNSQNFLECGGVISFVFLSITSFLMKYLSKILTVSVVALALTPTLQAQDSLQLADAVATAIEKNYGVVLSTNEAKISAINNNWGNAGLWPTIGFSGAYNYSNTNLNQELANGTTIKRNGVNNQSLTGSVALAWTIFDGMKMFATKDRLTELEKTGQTQLRKQILQTTYSVMVAYYNVVRYQQQITNTQEFISLLTEREKIASRAFEIGTSAKTDLLQSRLDLQTQQIALTQQQTALQKAKAELNRLLSRGPDAPMSVRNRFEVGVTPDFAALEAKMLSQNADWLLTQHAIAVATLSQKEIDAQKWPTLQVLSGYNLTNSRSDAGFTLVNQNQGPYAGLSLRVPILNGNTIRNQKQVVAVQQKSRSIEAESLKNDLQNYFYTARLDYQNAQQIMSQRAGNMELAKENANIALQQFKQKQIDVISLRQVQLNYLEAFTLWLDAQYQLKQAEAYLRLLAADFN